MTAEMSASARSASITSAGIPLLVLPRHPIDTPLFGGVAPAFGGIVVRTTRRHLIKVANPENCARRLNRGD
jgi:hypothetical protein